MTIHYTLPSKPKQHANIERFNRTYPYRDEVLSLYLLTSLQHVRKGIWHWMLEYNEERPNDSLGNPTPVEARLQSAGNFTFELSTLRGSLRNQVVPT